MFQKKRKKIISTILTGMLLSPATAMAQSAPNMEAILNSIVSGYPAINITNEFANSQAAIDPLAQSYAGATITNAEFQASLQNLLKTNSTAIRNNMQAWANSYEATLDTAFAANFTSFGNGLSQYYGEAMLFTHHLSNPIGYDHLGEGPVYTFGGGLGIGFSNVQNLSTTSTGDAGTLFNSISVLPAASLGINAGMSLSPKLDIRLSIFPKSFINLPVPDSVADKFNVIFSYACYKAKANLNVIRGDSMNLGLSLGAFLSYTQGKIEVNTKEVAQTSRIFTGTNTTADTTVAYNILTTPAYDIRTQSLWEFYTLGPEIKIWYNFNFFIPYIGYALAFQFGNFNSIMDFNSSLYITESVDTTVIATAETFNTTSSGQVSLNNQVSSSSTSSLMMHRIYFGIEIKIVDVSLVSEININPLTQMIGLSAAISVRI